MSWVETRTARPSSRRSRAVAGSAPRRAVDAGQRLVEQEDLGASCASARAISTRWRWPPESSPSGSRARSARPTRSSGIGRDPALGGAEAPVPGHARIGAHQYDVERADREVEPGPLGLRHVGDAAAALDPRRDARAPRRAGRGTGSSCRRRWGRGRRRISPASAAKSRPVRAGAAGARSRPRGRRPRAAGARSRRRLRGAAAPGREQAARAKTTPPSAAIAGPGGTSSS